MKLKAILTVLSSTLLAGAVSAADLPRRAPPAPVFVPVPVFAWTGFYAGINAGYAVDAGNNRNAYRLPAGSVVNSPTTNAAVGITGARRSDGFSGGGQVGYNVQLTPGSGFVFGVEADAQYLGFSKRVVSRNGVYVGIPGLALSPPAADVYTNGAGLDFVGTVRGRIGYAFDRTLVYATGGFAYGSGSDDRDIATATRVRANNFRTGYAAGGGIEYALPTDSLLNPFRASAVTLKAEALYVSLDRNRGGVTGLYDGATNSLYIASGARQSDLVVARAGLNYKFGGF